MATIVVAAFDFAISIANEYFHTFATAQFLFVTLFHTEVAGVVARTIVVVVVDIVLVNFAYVSENICCILIVVLTQNAALNEKSRETIQLFLKSAIVLSRKLAHKSLLRIRRIVWILARVLEVGNTLVEFFASDAKSLTEVDGVERENIARNHHHIVGRLVEHHQTPVAVVDVSSRGIYGFFHKSIAVGILLVGAVAYLEIE